MGCDDRQAVVYTQTLKVLAVHEPQRYAEYGALPPQDLAALVAAHGAEQVALWDAVHEGAEPYYKPREPGEHIGCYFLADLNYTQNDQACMLISDEKLRASCRAKARETYCEAFALCGGVK